MLSVCAADPERCDGDDNDCDGLTDEGYVDELGAYSIDNANCGACGIDCAKAGVALSCGGDPLAPSCVLACGLDGGPLRAGDHVDADRNVDTGCECTVSSLTDPAGGAIDANCDGADGEVRRSFYVAADGRDDAPGSPTRPLRSIAQAASLAAVSLTRESPRADVFVASGTYTEVVRVYDGVRLHGGYRRDFQALNPDGFEVLIVAPPDSAAELGAALVVELGGERETLVEGVSVRGFDAPDALSPAVGLLVNDPGPALTVRDVRVRTGKPRGGESGPDGAAAAVVAAGAGVGATPRAAREDATHACVADELTLGGSPGRNLCAGADVSGGNGASASCPRFTQHAPAGGSGTGAGAGHGGEGGTDVSAPVRDSAICASDACCGLADFSVPPVYQQAAPGVDGATGRDGSAGAACSDALGRFDNARWSAGSASGGTAAAAGSGGGGGGAGGGVEFAWFAGSCEFSDGLGGAGGGGGAGGCGGAGGMAGQSAAPAIGVLVLARSRDRLPHFERLVIETEAAGAGGDGGQGGDGAIGGRGGSGGALPREALVTPTLAGAAAGERGGNGGNGGAGGAAGGGCGGSSIGIWFAGLGDDAQLAQALREQVTFTLGAAGRPGRGGGGAIPAGDGAPGSMVDVLFR